MIVCGTLDVTLDVDDDKRLFSLLWAAKLKEIYNLFDRYYKNIY